MDFSKLISFTPGLVCILDSSAILENPDWEKYKDLLNLKASKNIYLLTGEVLNEIDQVNHRPGKNAQAQKFFENLRGIAAKTSEGITLENGDILYLCTENLSEIPTQQVHFIDEKSVDRKLIELAIKIKEADLEVAIVGRDSLIQILCLEFDLKYILVPTTTTKTSTAPAGGIPIDLHSVSGAGSSVISVSASPSTSPSPSEEE